MSWCCCTYIYASVCVCVCTCTVSVLERRNTEREEKVREEENNVGLNITYKKNIRMNLKDIRRVFSNSGSSCSFTLPLLLLVLACLLHICFVFVDFCLRHVVVLLVSNVSPCCCWCFLTTTTALGAFMHKCFTIF